MRSWYITSGTKLRRNVGQHQLQQACPAVTCRLQEQLHLHIVRVATDDNIADLPSRLVGACTLWEQLLQAAVAVCL